MNNALSILFGQLSCKEVRYFLLTDFECEQVTKDIDLYVNSNCKGIFERTLIESGWYKRKEPTHHMNHYFYYSPASEIYLDVKYTLSFANGNKDCYTYLYTDEAISGATLNSKGIFRPNGTDAIILYAAHLAYKERGKLEKKHRDLLTRYLDIYKSTDITSICTVKKISQWLENDFPGNTGKLQAILDPYFRYDQKKMVRSKNRFRFGLGVNVLFLGTDGAGKTTLIEAVESKLNIKTSRLYLGTGENGWSSPLIQKFYNCKFSIFNRSIHLFKTYILLPSEFILRIFPVKLRSKYSVVLIDRFPGTVFLDDNPARRFIYKFILPKPDIVFFLYADPNVLVKRKPAEVTLERSKADIIKFQKVADIVSAGNYISIDTSNMSIAEARELVISEIYKSPKVYRSLFTEKLN